MLLVRGISAPASIIVFQIAPEQRTDLGRFPSTCFPSLSFCTNGSSMIHLPIIRPRISAFIRLRCQTECLGFQDLH